MKAFKNAQQQHIIVQYHTTPNILQRMIKNLSNIHQFYVSISHIVGVQYKVNVNGVKPILMGTERMLHMQLYVKVQFRIFYSDE